MEITVSRDEGRVPVTVFHLQAIVGAVEGFAGPTPAADDLTMVVVWRR